NGSHGIAQFMQPDAPELVYRRYLIGLPNLALDVFSHCGKVKTAQHGSPDISEVDPVVYIDRKKVLAERTFSTILAHKGHALLERDCARKNFGVIRHLH